MEGARRNNRGGMRVEFQGMDRKCGREEENKEWIEGKNSRWNEGRKALW